MLVPQFVFSIVFLGNKNVETLIFLWSWSHISRYRSHTQNGNLLGITGLSIYCLKKTCFPEIFQKNVCIIPFVGLIFASAFGRER